MRGRLCDILTKGKWLKRRMTDIAEKLFEIYEAPDAPLRLRRFEEIAEVSAAGFTGYDSFYAAFREGLLFIFKPYVPHKVPEKDTAFVDFYFYAYQELYGAKSRILKDLKGFCPEAETCTLGYKGLLLRFGFGRLLHNTLVSVKPFGTFFGVEIIDTDPSARGDASSLAPTGGDGPFEDPGCRACGRCSAACPSGALTDSGFDRFRCLRQRQFDNATLGDPAETEMGNRLLGCNECQLACPHNAGILGRIARPGPDYYGLFNLEALAESCCRPGFKKGEYAKVLGYNYAKPVKVLGRTLSAMLNDDPAGHVDAVKRLMLLENNYAAPLLERYLEIAGGGGG